ncbi:hypothetical protein CRENBAI_003065 [Crenichthys baileyi]|uniref:Uncharacterized protein n=1 Tax=Crenichthys baileyi TaxID=28760 RepID=A0AAV9S5Z4_9TELE
MREIEKDDKEIFFFRPSFQDRFSLLLQSVSPRGGRTRFTTEGRQHRFEAVAGAVGNRVITRERLHHCFFSRWKPRHGYHATEARIILEKKLRSGFHSFSSLAKLMRSSTNQSLLG